jgi:hypothetical protein
MSYLQESLRKNIELKCNTVINSSEAKGHTDAKLLAESILTDISGRSTTNIRINQIKKEIVAKQKVGKAHMGKLAIFAVDGTHMLESVKPDGEVNVKNWRVKAKLLRMNDTKFLEECAIINADLQKEKQKLQEYGYTEEQVNQLSVALAQMSSITKELTATNLSYSAIRAQRDSADKAMLERLDKLSQKVEANKVLMPNLFRDYFAVKLATTKKPQSGINGSVTFEGQTVANASIKLYATRVAKVRKNASAKTIKANAVPKETLVYDKLSNSNGEINIRDLKPGTYRLTISKIGFKSQDITVYVNPKEFTLVDIKLEKL